MKPETKRRIGMAISFSIVPIMILIIVGIAVLCPYNTSC